MLSIWIVHRQEHERASLARIAGSADSSILGAPGDPIFESATPADVVVLGVLGDFEIELDFAHRVARRLPDCWWILLATDADRAEAERLFDTVPSEFLRFPPTPATLRSAIHRALRRREANSLSRRRQRDALTRRSSRWFADLELPEMLRALDPRMARVPTLALGEEGTGRGLLARYAHAHGGAQHDTFVHVPCRHTRSAADVLAIVKEATPTPRSGNWTVWLEDVDVLPLAVQSQLEDWIEFGLPETTLRVANVRWIASASDSAVNLGDALEPAEGEGRISPGLASALSGLRIRIPPLRSRSGCVEAFVADSALAWSSERGERPRRFSPDAIDSLRQYPWPGNFRELESVVTRTLSSTTSDPILSSQLCFGILNTPEYYEADAELLLPEAEILPSSEDPADTASVPGSAQADISNAAPDRPELNEPEIGDPGMDDPVPGEPVVGDLEADDPEMDAALASFAPEPEGRTPTLETQDHSDPDWPRLVRAVAHEIRNPLVSIRTFSEMLPERFDDAEFRSRFTELVGDDVRRIDDVVNRLQSLSEASESKPEPVDMASLLDALLDERRGEIQARRLLVLKELDRDQPLALADAAKLRSALSGLLNKALALVPDHGDVYIASRHRAAGLRGMPMLRVLLRYSHRQAPSLGQSQESIVVEGMALNETSLEVVVAERVVSALGGSLTVDASEGQETVLIIDLPAPTH